MKLNVKEYKREEGCASGDDKKGDAGQEQGVVRGKSYATDDKEVIDDAYNFVGNTKEKCTVAAVDNGIAVFAENTE